MKEFNYYQNEIIGKMGQFRMLNYENMKRYYVYQDEIDDKFKEINTGEHLDMPHKDFIVVVDSYDKNAKKMLISYENYKGNESIFVLYFSLGICVDHIKFDIYRGDNSYYKASNFYSKHKEVNSSYAFDVIENLNKFTHFLYCKDSILRDSLPVTFVSKNEN